MTMDPPDSQIKEYKQRAEELVQQWLNDENDDTFVRTCIKCNSTLRDTSVTGDEIVFIVSTLGAFMEHDSDVHYRCPNHSDDAEKMIDRLLTGRTVAITGVVQKKNSSFVLDKKSSTFYN